MPHNLAAFKPDFEDARRRWAAFWQGDIVDRPILMVRAPKAGAPGKPSPEYLGWLHDPEETVSRVIPWAESVYWGGDAVPTCAPCFGPDQFAAFLGGKMNWSPDSPSTTWADAFVNEWREALPLGLDTANPLYARMKRVMEQTAAAVDGRVVIAHLDLHSNLDGLSAMRGPARLCEDMLDYPELIDEAMDSVRAIYAPMYDELYQAGAMDVTGSSGWMAAYCEDRYNVIQCDAICLISPKMSRRWVIPALEEEANFLDHCIYHFDGPGALPHLEDILAIPGIDVIQWVPGDGQPPQLEWMDVLKRIQAAGKSIILHLSPAQVKQVHGQFDPAKVIYDCWAGSEAEARELEAWLVANM